MTVKAVTPTDAAASPVHPDHDRWVKERTLAMEASHVNLVGGTFREAEDANRIALERLSSRQQARKPKQAPAKRKKREVSMEELAAAGVTKRAAPVVAAPRSMCNYCGRCIRCKREARVLAISNGAKLGDKRLVALMWELSGLLLAAQLGNNYKGQTGLEYPFARITSMVERGRVRDAGFTLVCDRSVAMLGEWRR